ncbi:Hypothetical_protein [Hexamita inflata]|uniref:Hypothetical_protein n=1 Tax=Hexamita inflata TaxID=28002 RepID=A0AA86TKZ9_9EUKA|nr:Hypothetical protein HINF_LOCUS9404 [Hexamita inflata]
MYVLWRTSATKATNGSGTSIQIQHDCFVQTGAIHLGHTICVSTQQSGCSYQINDGSLIACPFQQCLFSSYVERRAYFLLQIYIQCILHHLSFFIISFIKCYQNEGNTFINIDSNVSKKSVSVQKPSFVIVKANY